MPTDQTHGFTRTAIMLLMMIVANAILYHRSSDYVSSSLSAFLSVVDDDEEDVRVAFDPAASPLTRRSSDESRLW